MRRPLAPIGVLFVCVVGVSSAEGCKQNSTEVPAARQAAGSDGSVPLAQEPTTDPSYDEGSYVSPEEFAIALRFRGGAAAGKVDVSNQYESTIMLAEGAKTNWPNCSGILLSERVALTAASCVCPPRYVTSQGGAEKGPIGPSACAERAFMTRVRYGSREDWKDTELPASITQRPLRGKVRVHPEFKIELNGQGAVLSTRADLAIIILDTPQKDPVERIPFAEREVQENETLVMVGYGDDPRFRDRPDSRYFRHNKVTKVRGGSEGRVLYEQQGAFVYNGYTGGPCFREDSGRRWLVGIASAGTEQELAFTSTYYFRDWLRAELQRATAAGPSSASPAAQHPQ